MNQSLFKRSNNGKIYVSESVLANMPVQADSDLNSKQLEEGVPLFYFNMTPTSDMFKIKDVLNKYCGDFNWKVIITSGYRLPNRVIAQKQLWFYTKISDNCNMVVVKEHTDIIRTQHNTQRHVLIHDNYEIVTKWRQRNGIGIYYDEKLGFIGFESKLSTALDKR